MPGEAAGEPGTTWGCTGEPGDRLGEAVPEEAAGELAGTSRVAKPGESDDVSVVPTAGTCTVRRRPSEGKSQVAKEPIGPTPAP